MKKYLDLVGCGALAASMVLATIVFNSQYRADPTDDFSFSLQSAQAAESVDLMSERAIRKVFEDHLDLFPKSQVPALARHLIRVCQKYRFDPAFVLSLIQAESSFRIKVKSPVGAVGLMQLMPDTAAFVAHRFRVRYTGARSLEDPFTNISLGTAYLSVLREKYRGFSPYFYVAAYNIGPARLDELRSQKGFKPVNTRTYYEKIRRGVPGLRHYTGNEEKKKPSTPLASGAKGWVGV